MKINAKDVASGALLILFAAVGLWLNQDHTLGSARRMGPGYMPMLVFWIQVGLGVVVLVHGLLQRARPAGEVDRARVLDAGRLGHRRHRRLV